MKLIRIALRDYRGVRELVLEPAPQGVTVVVGPNEIGKSSLKEALDLVFRYPHESRHREVMAAKPVNADAGAHVEVELETGPYRFVYEKQFHRTPRTVLTVLAPKPENLTGREAHERAELILAETLDVPLFKALSIAQGRAQEQLALGDQSWISRAFDRVAGSAATNGASGDVEQTLFDRAREEFEKYFTPKGQEGKALTGPQANIEQLEAERAKLSEALAALEADIAETARLAESIRKDEASLAVERVAKRELDAKLLELGHARDRLEAATKDLAAAKDALALANDGVEDRRKLEKAAQDARGLCDELARQRAEQAPAMDAAADKRAAAVAEFERLTEAATSARELARACAEDETFVRDAADLARLRERRTKLREAQELLAKQRARLGERPLDPKRVEALRKRSTELAVSAAKAAASVPKLTVRALRRAELRIDGDERTLEAGDTAELRGDARRSIELPGALEIRLEPGSDAESTTKAHAAREREWHEALDALGVRDLADAERRLAEEAEARSRIESLRASVEALLHDLSVEEMDAKIARLESAVAAGGERNSSAQELPESTYDARRVRQEAEERSEAARKLVEAALKDVRESESRAARLESEQASLAKRIELERANLERALGALEAARGSEDDATLAARAQQAAERVEAARAAAAAAQADVDRRQPAALDLETTNKHRVVADLEQRLFEQREKKARVDGRLESQGQEGLAEQLDAAVRKLALLEDELARTRRRAEAAKLLFETLSSEREDERRAYVRPLAERIESLGRIVYGPSLRITLNDHLAIESRTLDDVTVPFDSLSTGAKEQLGVLARLACAQIVADDGGVPLILDDVLGHTDPERLDKLAAVLATAAKKCQVLLFTSSPDRYRGIGGAKVVELARS